jgi:hypothetical protein
MSCGQTLPWGVVMPSHEVDYWTMVVSTVQPMHSFALFVYQFVGGMQRIGFVEFPCLYKLHERS